MSEGPGLSSRPGPDKRAGGVDVSDFYRSTEAVRDPQKLRYQEASLGNRQLLALILVPVCVLSLVVGLLMVVFVLTSGAETSSNLREEAFGVLGFLGFAWLGFLILRKGKKEPIGGLGIWILVPPIFILLIETTPGSGMLVGAAIAAVMAVPAILAFRASRPKGQWVVAFYGLVFAGYALVAVGPEMATSQLFRAIEEADAEAVAKIVEDGGSLHVVDAQGRTPLIFAVERGNHQIVEILLRGDGPLGRRDRKSRSALGLAVSQQDAPMIRLLVAAGAPVHTRPRAKNLRPLAQAVKDRETEMAVLLVEELRRKRLEALEPGDG